MEFDVRTKKLFEKANERKSGESIDETSIRVDDVLSRRNKVVDKIEDYQQKNGMPSDEEANDNFLKNEVGIGMSMKDLESFAVDEQK